MTSPDSVAPSERLRLFLALRLPERALDEIESWQAATLHGELRIVPREHLHITLAFLGHRPRRSCRRSRMSFGTPPVATVTTGCGPPGTARHARSRWSFWTTSAARRRPS